MTVHYSEHRKIGGQRPVPMRGDGTPDHNDRVEIGPTQLAYDEWAAAGLELPHLPTMRQQRLERLATGIQARGYAGAWFFLTR